MTRQSLARLGTHLTDAQSEDQAAQIPGLALLDGLQQLLRLGVALAPELLHLVERQVVQVGGCLHEALLNQCFNDVFAQSVDVHGIPGDKMRQSAAELGGTGCAGAAQECAICVPFDLCSTHGANRGNLIDLRSTLVVSYLQNLRDDLPCLADLHRVTDGQTQRGDEILVVEGGIGDRCARQTDRTNHRLGGQHAGASHLNDDILHHGLLDLRGILVRRSPPGELGGRTQGSALLKVVDLDHRAVDIEGEALPGIVDLIDPGDDLLGIGIEFRPDNLEFAFLQVFQGLLMAGKFHALGHLDIENQDIQLAPGGDFGVELSQRACGGVPGIGKEGLALGFPLLVELMEDGFGHEHLAPDNEPGGGIGNGHGNGADGFQIFCHILAHLTVAPGGTPDKHAVLVFQRHGQTVDLGFHGKFGTGIGFLHLFKKLLQLLHGEHILQAHQRDGVLYLLELTQRLAAHPLGGRLGQRQVRVLRFQLLQLPHQAVILKIRHLRGIQDIIFRIGIVEQVSQLPDSFFRFHSSLLSVNKSRGHPRQ